MALPVSSLRSNRSSLRRLCSSFLPISNKEMEENKGVGRGGPASPLKVSGLPLQASATKGYWGCRQTHLFGVTAIRPIKSWPCIIIWQFCRVHWLSLPMRPGSQLQAGGKAHDNNSGGEISITGKPSFTKYILTVQSCSS